MLPVEKIQNYLSFAIVLYTEFKIYGEKHIFEKFPEKHIFEKFPEYALLNRCNPKFRIRPVRIRIDISVTFWKAGKKGGNIGNGVDVV